ncbi:MAG: hypothetical protein CFE34_00140 [Rhodobacteraceae bacterium PARR1]|nr:MAG: hypothetical protein CFE34_00140 [Rhodobacteraceae bacterium PARR1]
MQNFEMTVAMSVYDGVELHHLQAALGSVLSQSGVDFEVCLVMDGIKREDLRSYLIAQADADSRINLIDFERNRKLPAALNAIVRAMKSDFLVRMDSDDLCVPGRFKVLVDFMRSNPDVDAAGSGSFEFSDGPFDQGLQRRYPQTHEEIVRQFNYNNPFCHPSMIFRKRFFELGLYPLWTLNEDTLLFLNGLAGGARYANIPQPLYAHRYDADVGKRRQNWKRSFTIFLDRLRVIDKCDGGMKARLYAFMLLLGQTLGGPVYPLVRRLMLKRRAL